MCRAARRRRRRCSTASSSCRTRSSVPIRSLASRRAGASYMTTRLENLTAALRPALGERLVSLSTVLGEVTVVVRPEHLLEAAAVLRDAPALGFEQLIDLCGVDYGGYG